MEGGRWKIGRGCGDRWQLYDEEDGQGKRREDAPWSALHVAGKRYKCVNCGT